MDGMGFCCCRHCCCCCCYCVTTPHFYTQIFCKQMSSHDFDLQKQKKKMERKKTRLKKNRVIDVMEFSVSCLI